jgi:glycosyltransferase involved in cell wall biosynthesis
MGGPLTRGPHVVVLIRSFGFPEGMAATNRVRLLGRALLQEGVDVRVLCLRVSERPGEARTSAASGVADGIPFRYTTGTPLRDDRFLVRRAVALKGFLAALAELARLRRAGRLDCAFLADGGGEPWSASVALLLWWLRRLGVPAVTELNEVPGTYGWAPARVAPVLSQLFGVDGALVISAWLEQWAAAEAARLHRRVRLLEVPIVVDTDEVTPGERVTSPPTFVYAASTEYLHDLSFVLRSLHGAWERFPEAGLLVTGMSRQRAEDVIREQGFDADVGSGRVTVCGYLSRPALLEVYREATALLIPLHDDLRSRARFPTKLGEYLAAGAPVVTCRVGEVERFLRDGESAFVAEPDEVASFAAKMVEVLEDKDRAGAVAAEGRRVAERNFAYGAQGRRLRDFILEVCAASGRRAARA